VRRRIRLYNTYVKLANRNPIKMNRRESIIIKRNPLRVIALMLAGLLTPFFAMTLAPAAAAAQPALPAFAASQICPPSASDPNANKCGLPQVNATQDTLKNIIQIGLGIIGAFALLSMTLSGFKYITSGGSPEKTSEAKKGIIFALVGLMIAIMAEAIVAFVVKWSAI
jgi:type IV secretion system pilin